MKSVLVTGGTGFFGKSFANIVIDNDLCDRLCIYSRSESKQAEMYDLLTRSDRDKVRFFIGDVRDRDRLKRAMAGVDTVIHAAALKRIEVGHYNPVEMVKTNIDGSVNVIEAAQDSSVRSVVYLSTDKAFQPVSAYGHSKAMGESLFIAANNTIRAGGPKFAVVRYGNVFNSTGSVVPRWRSLMAAGAESVPVTDPGCTRFFMSANQAVDFVLNAVSCLNREGTQLAHPLIPILPAYSIGDLAEAMGAGMVITGLPDWEKKHESMAPGLCSENAERMSIEDLKAELSNV